MKIIQLLQNSHTKIIPPDIAGVINHVDPQEVR